LNVGAAVAEDELLEVDVEDVPVRLEAMEFTAELELAMFISLMVYC
jgi:hypothetical protein